MNQTSPDRGAESCQRGAGAPAGGLDPLIIMVTATRTHNSFNTKPWHEDDDQSYAYLDFLKDKLHAVLKQATGRLKHSTFKTGSAIATGMTKNRRPIYRDATGHHQADPGGEEIPANGSRSP